METPCECAGVPRDLGVQQGRRFAAAIRAHLAAAGGRSRPGLGPDERALDRDCWRHFPHLAERQAGLAVGAGVSRRRLLGALAAEARGGALAGGPAAATAFGPLVAKLAEVAAPSALVVRRVRPEGGPGALELTLPWLAPAVAGVNEGGLAVAAAALPEGPPGGCRAPAWLLAQECLRHFESADSAAEWCLGRPAGGSAQLWLADAAGRALLVEVRGGRRALGEAGAPARRELFEKAWGAGSAAEVAACLCGGGGAAVAAVLDPRARALALAGPGPGAPRVAAL